MKKKRIVYITYHNIADLNAGDKIVSYSFLKQIADSHEVCLFNILDEGKYSPDSLSLIEKTVPSYKFCYAIKEAPYIAIFKSLFLFKPFAFTRNKNRFSISRKLQETIKEFNPDILIWDHFRTIAYFDIKLLAFKNLIIQHNNEQILYWQRGKNQKELFRKLFLYWQAFCVGKINSKIECLFAKSIYISSYDTKQKNINSVKLHLLKKLNLYFHHNSFHLKKNKKFDLLFLGSLDWDPNITGIIWFMDKVYPLLPNNIKVAIVGKNPTAKIYNYKNEGVEIFPNVASVESYYQSSKIFISPILTGGGINIKILEALSYGIPIVASSHSLRGYEGIDFIKHCVKPDEFASEILKLLNNWEYYCSLSKEEMKYYKNYNELATSELLNALLETDTNK